MRSLGLSLSGLACVVALIVIAPKPANSQPSVLPLVSSASGVEEVGYYYRRYGYGYRRPYYGYGYGYRRPYLWVTDTVDGGKPTPVRTITR